MQEGMSLLRWPGCIQEWPSCAGISKTLIQAAGWSATGNQCLAQSVTIRRGRKHWLVLFHISLNIKNSCILQQTECGLHQEQKSEAIYVVGLLRGSEMTWRTYLTLSFERYPLIWWRDISTTSLKSLRYRDLSAITVSYLVKIKLNSHVWNSRYVYSSDVKRSSTVT